MADIRFNTTEYLVDRFLDDIVRLALVYTRKKEDAQDVAQQVFLTYLQRKPIFESEEHAKRWLMKVAVNISKNMLRGRDTRNVSFDLLEGTVADETEDAGRTAEEEAVFSAVMSLKRGYREVVHLYYYEEMSTAQISELLGITEGGVRVRLARARSMLENKLKGGEYGEE